MTQLDRSMQRKLDCGGFSLVEVLLAVVLFSIGIIAVNRAFISSLDALGYAKFHMEAASLAEAKVWEMQKKAWLDSEAPHAIEKGTILGKQRTLGYEYKSGAAGISDALYAVRLAIRDESALKGRALMRDFYVRRSETKKM